MIMKLAKEIHKFQEPDGLRVITIGTGAPRLDLMRSAPCTLIQYKDKYFAVDLGYGASQQMARCGISFADITNVCFTHLHSDHSLDYGNFLIAGWHAGRKTLNVAGPKGTNEMHDYYCKMYDEDIQYRLNLGRPAAGILEGISHKTVAGGESWEWDGVTVTTCFVPHTAYTVAYKFEVDGQCVVVTGDTMYHEPLIEFMKGGDLVVMDANQANSSFLAAHPPAFVKNLEKSHATMEQVAQMAQKSQVPSVVLTHFTPGTYMGEVVQNFAKIYDGEIILAEDRMAIDV